MQKRILFFLSIFWLFYFSSPLCGKVKGVFYNLSIDHGLSQNTVHCIFQGSKGFMWFGTRDGLNRYDGRKFKKYYHDPDDPDSLSDNTVLNILEDYKGMLWIGTHRGGVNRFNPERESFTRFTVNPADPEGLSCNDIQVIVEDKRGVLWIGTWGGGLHKFAPGEGKIRRLKNIPGLLPNFEPKYITGMCVSRSGHIWIGTTDCGLTRFDPVKEIFINHYTADSGNPQSLSNNNVSCIIEDTFGAVWVGTSEYGLNRLSPGTGQFTRYNYNPGNPYGLSFDTIDCILESKSGDIWVGSWNGGGLNKFDRRKNKFFLFKSISNNPLSLSQDKVNSLFESNTGILWIGTYNNGVDKYILAKEEFIHYKNNPENINSLSHNVVTSICEDQGGGLWVGTRGGGFNKFDLQRGIVTRYGGKSKKSSGGLGKDYVSAIYEDRRGRLWVGTLGGLYIFDRVKNKLSPFKSSDEKMRRLARRFTRVIMEDYLGVLWIGTDDGLYAYNFENDKASHYSTDLANPGSLSHNRVRTIYETRSGILWVGTFRGLNRYDRERNRFTRYLSNPGNPKSLSQNDVISLCEDHRGILWVGTYGGGLNKLVDSGPGFIHYDTSDGLPNNVILGILEDDLGFLWISSNKGLSRFDSRRETFVNYSDSDGLQSSEFFIGASFKSKSGKLYFGGINGFNGFYPQGVLKNLHVPPVEITAVKIYSGVVDAEANRRLYREAADKDEIVLTHKENTFSIEFAALDYTNPSKNQHAYMLDGLDKDWIYTGNKGEAVFLDLKPGEYIFCAKGSNNSGIWNEKGLVRKIKILPPLSPGVRPFIFAALFIVFVFLLLFFRAKKRNRAHRREKQFDIDRFFSKYSFSDREKEITMLLLQGKSKKEIEAELFISPHTVKNNIYNIYRKLGIRNRIEIIKLLRDSD